GNVFTLESGKKAKSRGAIRTEASETTEATVPFIAASSLLGRMIVLLRENKIAISVEIVLMLTLFFVIQYFGSDQAFGMCIFVLFSLWLRGSNLGALGMTQPKSIKLTLLFGVIAGILIQVLVFALVIPILTSILG